MPFYPRTPAATEQPADPPTAPSATFPRRARDAAPFESYDFPLTAPAGYQLEVTRLVSRSRTLKRAVWF